MSLLLRLPPLFRASPSVHLSRQARSKSTLTIFPAEKGIKQLALPIAFLAVQKWDSRPSAFIIWKSWAAQFSRKGYTCFFIDIDPREALHATKTSNDLFSALEAELKSLLVESSAAFPPLLISSSLSTLLAETYVSSNPLSGLLLHTPPTPTLFASLPTRLPDLFKTRLTPFDYEPRFSIAVMHDDTLTGVEGGEGQGKQVEKGRLEKGFVDAVEGDGDGDVTVLKGGLDDKGWEKVMEWMDDNGM